MMKIIETPQRSDKHIISHKIKDDVLTITINDESEVFDFTGLPNGELDEIEVETLPINPIVSAKKENGELEVTLLRFYNQDEKHLFEVENAKD